MLKLSEMSFSFPEYAKAILKQVDERAEDHEGYSLAISGSWGSGKSTLIDAIEQTAKGLGSNSDGLEKLPSTL